MEISPSLTQSRRKSLPTFTKGSILPREVRVCTKTAAFVGEVLSGPLPGRVLDFTALRRPFPTPKVDRLFTVLRDVHVHVQPPGILLILLLNLNDRQVRTQLPAFLPTFPPVIRTRQNLNYHINMSYLYPMLTDLMYNFSISANLYVIILITYWYTYGKLIQMFLHWLILNCISKLMINYGLINQKRIQTFR